MRKVRTIQVSSHDYEVFIASPDEHDGLAKGEEGICDFSGGQIVLHEEQHFSRMRETYIHEIQLAVWDASGLGYWVRGETGWNYKRWKEFQETFLRIHNPSFIGALSSAGLLVDVVPGFPRRKKS